MVASPQTLLGLSVALVVLVLCVLGLRGILRRRAEAASAESGRPEPPRVVRVGHVDPVDASLRPQADSTDEPPVTLLEPVEHADWSPPETPVDMRGLEEIALAGRISSFAPQEVVLCADPPSHDPWMVDPLGLARLDAGECSRGFVESSSSVNEGQPIESDGGSAARTPAAAGVTAAWDESEYPDPELAALIAALEEVRGETGFAGGATKRGHVPEFVLAAPVELWFGESRVGVRSGTDTCLRFKRIADALLIDLNASKQSSR